MLPGQIFYGEVTEVDDALKLMAQCGASEITAALRRASEHFHEAQRWPDAIDAGIAGLIAVAEAK